MPTDDQNAQDATAAEQEAGKPLVLTTDQDTKTVLEPILKKLEKIANYFPDQMLNDQQLVAAKSQADDAEKQLFYAQGAYNAVTGYKENKATVDKACKEADIEVQNREAGKKASQDSLATAQGQLNLYESLLNPGNNEQTPHELADDELKKLKEDAEGQCKRLKTELDEADQLLEKAKRYKDQTEQKRKQFENGITLFFKDLRDPDFDSNQPYLDDLGVKAVINDQTGREKLQTQLEELQKRLEVTNTKKQAYVNTLKKNQETLKKAFQSKHDNLTKAINQVRAIDLNADTNYPELSKALGKLADVTPTIYGEMVRDFKQVCDNAEYQREVDKIKQTLTDKIFPDQTDVSVNADDNQNNQDTQQALSDKVKTKLTNSSDKRSITIEIDAGVAAAILGAEAKAVYTISATIEVSKDSQGRLVATFKHAHKIQLSAKAGGNIGTQEASIESKLAAALEIGKSRIYTNENDFIEHETKTLIAAMMAPGGSTVAAKKDDKDKADTDATDKNDAQQDVPVNKSRNIVQELNLVRKANNLSANAGAAGARLENRLKNFSMISKTQQLHIKRTEQANYIDQSITSASLDAEANVTLNINQYVNAAAALGDGIKHVCKVSSKQSSFLDDIQAEPVLQKIHSRKNPKGVGFYLSDGGASPEYLSGERAINELNRIEQDIARLKSDSGNQKELLMHYQDKLSQSLSMLHQEYEDYMLVANLKDQDIAGSNAQQRLRDWTAGRGAKSREEYVQAMNVQFARLRGLYERCFENASDIPPETANLHAGFAADLKMPKMKVNTKDLDVKSETKPTKITALAGFVKFGAGGKGDAILNGNTNDTKATETFKVAVYKEYKETPGFPDEENVKLQFNLNSAVKGDNYLASILEAHEIKQLFGDSKLDVNEKKRTIIKNLANGSVEINFTKRHGKWVLKNAKGFAETDLTIGGQVKIGADVKAVIGMRLKSSAKQVKNIYFGDNTLQALPDLFRAKHYDTKDRATQQEQDAVWDDFRRDKDVLQKIAGNLKTQFAEFNSKKEEHGNSGDNDQALAKKWGLPLVGDMLQWTDQLKKSGQNEEAKKFMDIMKNTKAADGAIEDALSELVRAKVARDNQVIADGFKKRHKLDGQDLRQYVAAKLSDEMEDINEELGGESTTSLDDLVEKAKSAYTNSKTDADTVDAKFRLLKRAYALEYTAKQFDELVDGKDKPQDINKTIKLLGSMKTMLDSDTVYLNDGVKGTLMADGTIAVQPASRSDAGGSDATGATALNDQTKKRVLRRHSLSARTPLTWNGKMNIAEALSRVMEERYKRKRQQNVAAHGRRKSSVV